MKNLPLSVYSGGCHEGHVQGVQVDKENGFVYFAFTTMLLKTDLLGNAVGSVKNLAGHLGCISFNSKTNKLYGSLELKHDIIGAGIMKMTGKQISDEDAFYLVEFDCASITKMDMDAENDGVMKAVYLKDVVLDYSSTDEASDKRHRYGCSGIDGTSIGPVFGGTEEKIMVAYGIYLEADRIDNDYQVILQYDLSIFDKFGQSLNQIAPHHSGPEKYEERYFFYTGNTNFGIQNLEYDPFLKTWFVAVYRGNKPEFKNYLMYFIDGTVQPKKSTLLGRKGEEGLVLTSAKMGEYDEKGVYGSMFPYGQTGMASMGDGTFYFSRDLRLLETKEFASEIYKYRYTDKENLFIIEE